MIIRMERALQCAVLATGLLFGCGDDAGGDGGGSGGSDSEGEKCLSPGGLGMCLCENSVLGTRSCGMDGLWTECSCPPVSGDPNNCREGEKFRCGETCSGDAEPRIVECPPSGKIDCSCGPSGDGGMLDATTPVDSDAG